MEWFAILIGLVLVIIASFILYYEINKALTSRQMKFKGINDDNVEAIVNQLDKIDHQLEEINAAFYEVSNELEGELSLHSRDLRLMEERLVKVEESFVGWKKTVTKRLPLSDGEINEVVIPPSEDTIVQDEDKQLVREQKKFDKEVDRNLLREEVVKLRATGMSLPMIAKHLNVGLGEIQLVMNLKRSE